MTNIRYNSDHVTLEYDFAKLFRDSLRRSYKIVSS